MGRGDKTLSEYFVEKCWASLQFRCIVLLEHRTQEFQTSHTYSCLSVSNHNSLTSCAVNYKIAKSGESIPLQITSCFLCAKTVVRELLTISERIGMWSTVVLLTYTVFYEYFNINKYKKKKIKWPWRSAQSSQRQSQIVPLPRNPLDSFKKTHVNPSQNSEIETVCIAS